MPATVTRVPVPGVANTAFTLAAARERRGMFVYNDTAGDLFVMVGAGASNTSFTVKVVAGGFYELPESYWIGDLVTAACSVIAGAVQVTEVV